MALRYFCLVNVSSGGKKGSNLLEQFDRLFSSGAYEGRAEKLEFNSLCEQIERAKACDRFLVGGGDGTLSTVLAAVSDLAPSMPVGVIPLGTGNDLAREYGILTFLKDASAEDVLEYYCPDHTAIHSLWSLRYGDEFSRRTVFSNYASFGFDARVVKQFADWRKSYLYSLLPASRIINRALYVAACSGHFMRRFSNSELEISIDESPQRLSSMKILSVVVPNIRSVMGLGETNHISCPGDEKIELIITRSLFDYFSMILNSMRDTPLFGRPLVVGSGKCLSLEFAQKSVVQVDGEARSEIEACSFLVERHAAVSVYLGRTDARSLDVLRERE